MEKIDKKVISIAEASAIICDKKNKAKEMHKSVKKTFNAKQVFQLTKQNNDIIVIFESDAWIVAFEAYFNHHIEKYNDFYSPLDAKDFILNVDNYLKRFFDVFNNKKLDYTLNSILVLEIEIQKKQKKEGTLDEEILYPVVAYIGEIILRDRNGNWDTIKGKSGEELPIIRSRIKDYDPYICIRSILSKKIYKYSLWAAINNQIVLTN